jgi:hypothetical protein
VERSKAIFLSGAVVVLLVALFLGRRACDRAGYWPRREEARVYTGADAWPAGEMRKCSALPREDGSIFFLGCVEGAENFDDARAMTVTFWGRTQRPDRFRALHSEALEGWEWRCKNSGGSLTCYAVN